MNQTHTNTHLQQVPENFPRWKIGTPMTTEKPNYNKYWEKKRQVTLRKVDCKFEEQVPEELWK